MLEELKYKRALRRINLAQVFESFEVDFEDIRGELKFICINPEHDDTTPSCTMNYDNQDDKFSWFYCFGCGYSGKLPKFISTLKNCSIEEAKALIIKLSRDSSCAVGDTDYRLKNNHRSRFKIKIKLPEEFISITPETDNSYKKYLLGRGVLEEDIYKYGWGFCPVGFRRKRVVLPIYIKNKLVNYFARHITTDREEKKVKNAPYSKVTKVVFPYDEIDFDLDYIWITESIFNFFKGKRIHIPNLTCLFGNKIGDWKAKLLSKFSEVRILQDGDEGGEELVRRTRKTLGKEIKVRKVKMVPGEDAASIPLYVLKDVIENLTDVQIVEPEVETSYEVKK